MNKFSPETLKSVDTFHLSESEYNKNDETEEKHSRNSSKGNSNNSRMISTHIPQNMNMEMCMNSDLKEQCDYTEENNGEKDKESNITIRFIQTEVISGKTKTDLCHESRASDYCSSEFSESINNGEQIEEKPEDSIENSGLVMNLMGRRGLSPQINNHQDNPHIHIGSLSGESDDNYTENSFQRSQEDWETEENFSITDPGSNHEEIQEQINNPIRVEDEFWEDNEVRIIYPPINEVIPEVPETETEGNKDSCIEESKKSFSSSQEEGLKNNCHIQNDNLLVPGSQFSPVQTCSRQSIPDSTNSLMSPPGSFTPSEEEGKQDSDTEIKAESEKENVSIEETKEKTSNSLKHKNKPENNDNPLKEKDLNSEVHQHLSPISENRKDYKESKTCEDRIEKSFK